MPRLKIDNREIDVPPGTTVLAAAKQLGIDIPTLCHWEGCTPQTSCLVCLVKINNASRLVPSCATVCTEGMNVESETPEVHGFRRSAIELLLAEHAGDCFAPCTNVCPAHMDIPSMMRHIHSGDLREAVITVKRAIPLPATLGRICPELCEKGCRRKDRTADDAAVSICSLKRYVGDKDLENENPYLPTIEPATGKSVAIIGSGPAGLSAAWFLRQKGHAITVYDDHPLPGGALRYAVDEEILPRSILNAEINLMKRLGINFIMSTRIGSAATHPSFDDIKRDYDAVLLAVGPLDKARAASFGVDYVGKGIKVDRDTLKTSQLKIFAAGSAIIPANYAIRAVADGQLAAKSIHHFLSQPGSFKQSSFASRLGRLTDDEMHAFFENVPTNSRCTVPHQAGFADDQARAESSRCGSCDCAKLHDCRLRKVADAYNANPARYRGARRPFQREVTHPALIYESGKCILCGLCVDIASRAREPLGLTFIGRGFNVHVGVPLNQTMTDALQKVAEECARACPSGAITLRNDAPPMLTRQNDGPVRLSLPQLRASAHLTT